MPRLTLDFDNALMGVALEGDSQAAVTRRAIDGLKTLNDLYGPTYRAINETLELARESSPGQVSEETVDKIEQVRTDFVLAHKSAIRRLQTTINEMVPGSYPIDDDEPLQSGDVPCTAMLAAAGVLGAIGIASSGAGVGLAAIGASGFLIGYAGAAEADGACA